MSRTVKVADVNIVLPEDAKNQDDFIGLWLKAQNKAIRRDQDESRKGFDRGYLHDMNKIDQEKVNADKEKVIGYIAQELESVYPAAVLTNGDKSGQGTTAPEDDPDNPYKYLAKEKLIESLQLIGATRFFVKAPFIIEGVLLGFIGSILSCALLIGALEFSNDLIYSFLSFEIYYDMNLLILILCSISILITFIGSSRAIAKFLK